ncbi:DUF779 domain-containing protein [Coraliomargarita sp. SDUM461003]|uniref:DUF779 domain-containing protein n=1 Tax=Thalassobacterium maritimum TaxID=3041265 RepID=A0ABU1AV02_9BACT|nr:DUF779 domain-containing protein [Coraliomargarita sp. SDUM461003]MDQ8207970.1 DUF779 domain-containing protein [Coraliomargarita sp. SDUM461003]
MPEQVQITKAAAEIVRQLKVTHGPLMFHLSGGCCDGSAPMCFAEGDFILGSRDLQIGNIEACPFYIAADTYKYYKNSAITIDVTAGRGASFSLEIPLGVRFLMRSELLTKDAPAK